jgi:hypothetical protein
MIIEPKAEISGASDVPTKWAPSSTASFLAV